MSAVIAVSWLHRRGTEGVISIHSTGVEEANIEDANTALVADNVHEQGANDEEDTFEGYEGNEWR
jgi:hypothetical protein